MGRVEVWTDGATIGNPGPGGWAALVVNCALDRIEQDIAGGVPHTTNNRMELLAAIMGLGPVIQTRDVVVISDSRYVVNGGNRWMHTWKGNGWMRGSEELLNADLWRRLYAEVIRTGADFKWVKGHSGVEHNVHCDRRAKEAARMVGR